MALSKETLVMLMSSLMSEISEEAYCSTWEMSTEYAIWQVIQETSSDLRWKGSISADQITVLRELSAELDGWLVFDEENENDVCWVPMAEWHRIYEAYVDEATNQERTKESL